jgi:phosphatidate phosphatase APP1
MSICELKLYRGYANKNEFIVFGHAFKKYPSKKDLYDRKGFKHINSIIQLFTLKTIANIRVVLRFGTVQAETRTLDDGYFRFQLPLDTTLKSGWHTYQVSIEDESYSQKYQITREGELLMPDQGAYTFISDIDDTFLISYSRNLLKKFYVLLSKNVESRMPFEDVVKHYRLLSFAGKKEGDIYENSFFYVSSSEWNLYEYILRFTTFCKLPKAVVKLKKIKDGLTDFMMTGSGSHDHKEKKIRNIIHFYPDQQFILLGDDSQQDPFIYQRIATDFTTNIKAVYIRQTRKKTRKKASEVLKQISALGISICYYNHSSEAILHSERIGVITQKQLAEFEHKEKKVI